MTYFPAWQYQVCGEIRVKYDSLGNVNSFLLWPTSGNITNPDGVGQRVTFVNGPIYWHPNAGAHPVVNHFMMKWGEHSWEAGYLGYPATDEIVLVNGRKQEFQGGTIYWSPVSLGAVSGAIRAKYNDLGAEAGPLGFPITDEIPSESGETNYGQVKNHFIGGALYYDFPTQRVRHGRWIDVLVEPDIEEDWELPEGTESPIEESTSAEGPTVTPMFQTPCDPATTGHTGAAAEAGWNCELRFLDAGGTGVNVRKGTLENFGRLHYKRHWVEDRWVELFLQGNYPRLSNTPLGGTRGNYLKEYYVGDELNFEDHVLGFQVGVQFGPANSPDGHQVGVITAYCYLPGPVAEKIPHCPERMPPGLGFTRTVPLGE